MNKGKLDVEPYTLRTDRMDALMDKFKENLEANTNHFIMVENFIDKYMPLRIQNQIAEMIEQVFPEMKFKLHEYNSKTVECFHKIIMDDEGVPKILQKIKEVRHDIQMYDPNYVYKRPNIPAFKSQSHTSYELVKGITNNNVKIER